VDEGFVAFLRRRESYHTLWNDLLRRALSLSEIEQLVVDHPELLDPAAELVALWNMGGVYDLILDKVVAAHGIADRTADLRSRLADATEELYRSRALSLLPPGRDTAHLATEGLFPLIGYDRMILEGLALLGLACSIDPREHAVAAAFRATGRDLSALLAWIDARHVEGLFPPVFRYGSTCLMPSL